MRSCGAGQSPPHPPRLAAAPSTALPPCQQSSDAARNSMREQSRAGLPLSPGSSRALAAPPALASHFTASTTATHDSPLGQMRWWLRGCAGDHGPFELPQPTTRSQDSWLLCTESGFEPHRPAASRPSRDAHRGRPNRRCFPRDSWRPAAASMYFGKIRDRNCAELNVSARSKWLHEAVSHRRCRMPCFGHCR